MTAKINARTGRIHWKKPDNPKPLEIIQQGYQALNYLTIFPALTGWQVCKLLFLQKPNRDGVTRSDEAAKRAVNRECLRPLKNLGLVGVKPIARLDNPLAKWELNYLTPAGHKALSECRTGLGLATLPYRSASELNYQTINPHTMAIIDAGVSAYAACTRAGVTVEVWLDDRAIRSLSKRGQLHWPMEPDFLLVISHEVEKRAFIGEVDLGTESVDSPRVNSFSTKLENYKRYFKEMRPGDPWLRDLPQPQLLVVTPSDRRLQNLKDVIRRSGGRSAYWFTQAKYLEPPYSFYGEVWQRIGLDGYHSIFSLYGASYSLS